MLPVIYKSLLQATPSGDLLYRWFHDDAASCRLPYEADGHTHIQCGAPTAVVS